MAVSMRVLPAGFVPPCLPTKARQPPSGELWLHEIKHDGFRVIARKNGKHVRLYSRPGNDLTYRFALIVGTVARLRPRSCIIDGEAVCCGDDGMPSFDRIRYRRHDESVFLYAFDLIELNGDDLRREPFDTRKATLASLLRRAGPGLRSTSTSKPMGRPCTPMPARWAGCLKQKHARPYHGCAPPFSVCLFLVPSGPRGRGCATAYPFGLGMGRGRSGRLAFPITSSRQKETHITTGERGMATLSEFAEASLP
jgi:ATP dependent DNA ligase domain